MDEGVQRVDPLPGARAPLWSKRLLRGGNADDARVGLAFWIPAFAGMTEGRGSAEGMLSRGAE